MAQYKFELPNGPLLNDVPQTDVVLGELTGVQYAECLENAEKAIQVPLGLDDKGRMLTEFQLIVSPAKMSMLVLRARIVKIGAFPSPISDSVWDKLTPNDINLMLEESEKFDDALVGVAQQGEY